MSKNFHRMGGGSVENLRLKPKEEKLTQPGISVIEAPTPAEAVRCIREAFPKARVLRELSKTVGSTTEELIRDAGFDIIPFPSRQLPTHHRIVHPDGSAGFSDANLDRLSRAFTDTTGI